MRKLKMTRKAAELYAHYDVPPNVQRHQLRVASVADVIIRNWNGPDVCRSRVIKVLLVHDLGNIVKCDFDRLPHLLEEGQDNLEHFRAVQARYRARFGTDDHAATFALCREAGLNNQEMTLLLNMAFEHNDRSLQGNDFEAKIAAYSDQRVGPFGLLSLKDRFDEIKQRYRGAAGAYMHSPRADQLIGCAFGIEEQISVYCGIIPASIDDALIRQNIDTLRSFEI